MRKLTIKYVSKQVVVLALMSVESSMSVDYVLSQTRWMIPISRSLLQHKVNPAEAISSQHLLYILASENVSELKSFSRYSRIRKKVCLQNLIPELYIPVCNDIKRW